MPPPPRQPDPELLSRGPLRIQAVAALTGVPSATLRAWERRYGVPAPARAASAYRLYAREDVTLIVAMRDLVAGGMSPSDAARAVLGAPAPAAGERTDRSDLLRDPLDASLDRILAAVAAYDADAIDREIGRAAAVSSAQVLFERLIGPASVRIGDQWHEGVLTVAQEHLASERFTTILRAHLQLLQPPPPAPHALLGASADDEHVLGLLGAAICFAASGWRVTLLGARTTPAAVADAARALAPDLVGISLTVTPERTRARELVAAYAEAAGAIPWVMGGAGAGALEQLIVKRGGIVARGTGSQWQKEARRWLRPASNRHGAGAEGGPVTARGRRRSRGGSR